MRLVSKAFRVRKTASAWKTKQRLLSSCAIAAGLSVLASAEPARAQLQGTVASGSTTGNIPSINHSGPTTTVTVSGADSRTILNWLPDSIPSGDVSINMLPAGSTLNFIGAGDYTVLNRFVNAGGGSLANQIALNGEINAYVGSTAGPRGGNIWFYNAGGILIGETSVINVGSLLLTTNDIPNFVDLIPGATIRVRGADDSQSSIQISNGAQINAHFPAAPGSSYVAMVAPRILQQGVVITDGATAYVAAESADIRINAGMFDINVLTGASEGEVITHTGITTGAAHQDANPNDSRIYFVAVPKNDAVSMLVSGQVGYQDATVAQTEPNGAIRLAAGYNIVAGELSSSPAASTGSANITVSDTLFTSSVSARASGAMAVAPQQTLPPFAVPMPPSPQGRVEVRGGDGLFIGDASATLTLGANQIVGATGSFTLQSSGTASALVTGGTLAVVRDMSIQSTSTIDPVSGEGIGGRATFTQTGGIVSVGALRVEANASGQTRFAQSGEGFGGTAEVNLFGGGLASSSLTASANGAGGAGLDGNGSMPAGTAGAGRGGQATITVDGGSVAVSNVIASATGTGGSGGDFLSNLGAPVDVPGGVGGDGLGGEAAVNVISGSLTVDTLIADASAVGGVGGTHFSGATGIGSGGDGGGAEGGTASILLGMGMTGSIRSAATGAGGAGGFGANGGAGGNASGGLAHLIVDDFDAGLLDVIIDSSATGGAGSAAGDGAGGSGGTGAGGVSRYLVEGANGAAIIANENFSVVGAGGIGGAGLLALNAALPVGPDGGDGGDGEGGVIEIRAADGAAATIASTSAAPLLLSSLGTGGWGGSGAVNTGAPGLAGGAGGDGGRGTGGAVRLIADGGVVTTNGVDLELVVGGSTGAAGIGGSGTGRDGFMGGNGGSAGGAVLIEADNGQIALGAVTIRANGDHAGRAELVSRSDGRISMTGLVAEAFGASAPTNGDVNLINGLKFVADGGEILIDGSALLRTRGSFAASAAGNGNIQVSGDLTIEAEDEILFQHGARQGNGPTLQVDGDLLAAAENSIIASNGVRIVTGGDLSLSAMSGSLTLSELVSGGATYLVSYSGDVAVSDLASAGMIIVEGDAVDIDGSGDLIFAALEARSGDITVSTDGDLSVPVVDTTGGLFLTAGGTLAADVLTGASVALSGSGGVQVDSVVSGGETRLASALGNVAITDLTSAGLVTVAAEAVDIGGAGDLRFADITAEDATLAVAGDLGLEAITIQNRLDALAGGVIRVGGIVSAVDISFSSANIDILPTARLGVAGVSQRLYLHNSDGGAVTYLGGDAPQAGYHLDADEMARLSGSDIRITSAFGQGAGVPSIVIDSLSMTGENLGAVGGLAVETPGAVRIVGAVELSGLTDDNLFAILAGEDVEVLTSQGLIQMSGNSAVTGGRLQIQARNLFAASSEAIGDIRATSDLEQIAGRLSENDGLERESGTLFARSIDIQVADGMYVQNSGVGLQADTRRGLTVGAGGLNVTTGGERARIVINGVMDDGGDLIEGAEFMARVSINGLGGPFAEPVGFDTASSINGCLILGGASCGVDPEPEPEPLPPEFNFPIQDVLATQMKGSRENRFSVHNSLITLQAPDWLENDVGSISVPSLQVTGPRN